ncbi:Mix23p NDAI_0E04630 [Naumovozyma dairenensis CBS 421]|uniref:Uncharacterized protein n=1 Tax=Naumovozyma dairenensis (strain ATCC 10597 / BCRC 20456 / CBS 421 / NBRC 0211 / NRRL Y-12639) TaxID=1071378 RepID=G0WC10_NAUDC|nr:hypothetical protein NDAI_0E04630 [Naumovozyma dairenensis CBS 421]CCD25280.1 hypothetical protein NDAI_0E04630 [Naumovozyma dairenensis CBS 421]
MRTNTYERSHENPEGNSNKITVKFPQQLILDSNLNFSIDSRGTNNRRDNINELVINRKRCIHSTLVDSFLRMLRHSSDDTLRQKINDYSKRDNNGNDISNYDKCRVVKNELYENWKVRTDIINFCDKESQNLKRELDAKYSNNNSNDKPVDPRLDPYAARDYQDEQESQYGEYNKMRTWVANNLHIESILQNTSDRILKQNCDQNKDYLKEFQDLLKYSQR